MTGYAYLGGYRYESRDFLLYPGPLGSARSGKAFIYEDVDPIAEEKPKAKQHGPTIKGKKGKTRRW